MQKFIVTSDGRFKYGDVSMHRDLLSPGEQCIGGGMYEFDHVHNALLLSGKSYDFGRVKWGYLDSLSMPAALRGLDIFYEDLPISAFADIKYE